MADPSLTPATKTRQLAHTPKYSRLTRDDLHALLAMHRAGKTQVEIAQALGCHQATVSKWIASFTDSTDSAKAYLRGEALTMARNIVNKGRAADHVAALKGLSVLEESEARGVTVLVGPGGMVNFGTVNSPLSPHRIEGESESPQKP